MSVVDLAAKTILGTVAVGNRPYAVALAKGRGFSTDHVATLQSAKRISVGDYPEGIETSAVTAKMPAGDGPRAFGTFLREAP